MVGYNNGSNSADEFHLILPIQETSDGEYTAMPNHGPTTYQNISKHESSCSNYKLRIK